MTACLLSQAISTTKYDHLLKAVKVHFPADSQTASSQQHPHLYFPLFTTVIFISATSPKVVTATCCHLTLISFAILHDFTQHAEDCAQVHTLYLFIHLFIQWNISSLTWLFFFFKTRQEKPFLFYFLPSALQGRFQQYENTAGNWDSPSVPPLLQPTRGTGKMALTCLLEYQRVVWPSHLKVLYVSILWLFHSPRECISYLKLLSQFCAHRSNRNQFLTSSSASKSRSIHFIFRYFKNFLLNSLFFFCCPSCQPFRSLFCYSEFLQGTFPSL